MSDPSNPFWWCQECKVPGGQGRGWVYVDAEGTAMRRCPNCNPSKYDPREARVNRATGRRADG